MSDFGIGPGCESATGRAVPPVRMRELAEHFAPNDRAQIASICEADFGPVLSELAAAIMASVP